MKKVSFTHCRAGKPVAEQMLFAEKKGVKNRSQICKQLKPLKVSGHFIAPVSKAWDA